MSSSDCVLKRNPDQEQGLNVLVVTGASGGHIFPAVSFIDSLKQRYPDSHVLLVLPRKNAAGTLKNCRCQTRYLDLGSLRIRFNRSAVYGFFHFVAAFWRSFKLILSFRLYRDWETDRKSTRLNSSHSAKSRMPSSA